MKTISCTLIIRDEASTLPALISSIRPHVDELVIVDTGSKDDSLSIASRAADKFEVWTGCNDAEGRIQDFSAARNHALSLATGDALCWFDGDDLVRGGENLRKLASEAPGDAWVWLAPYEYERNAAGQVVTLQWRERLVYPRAGFEWRGPVHEGLLARAGTVPTYMQTDALVVEHMMGRSSSKPRDPQRNLRILEAHVRRVGETDQRILHYFGAELMYNGRIGEARYWFRRHAQLSGWSDERALSLMHLARIAFAMGDCDEALDWALKAIATKSWPEPWWLAGQACCQMAEMGIEPDYNYRRGVTMLQYGFRADTPGAASLLMRDPTSRYEAHAWLAPALLKLGQVEAATISAQEGLAGAPNHATLKPLGEQLLTERAKNEVRAGMVKLHEMGALAKEAGIIVEATLRGEFKVERKAPSVPLEWKGKFVKADWHGLDIVFFLGHAAEPWTPRTLEANGMGGSETMAWEMAKRLAAKGNRVRVFAHTGPGFPLGYYDGVEWFDESDYRGITCDLLISSRRHDAVHAPGLRYKAAVLWVHDVHVGESFTPHTAVKYDFIWCLSNWHKEFFCSCYPWLNKDKVEVTRNGIDPDRFRNRPGITRNPHRAIYSSSPDRGLADAVAAWPAVRRAIPDAELHVYYSFLGWEQALVANGDSANPRLTREAKTRLVLACQTTEGVVLHGKVNQRDLAQAMLSAGVWAYSTWFTETSCITAMECQAAGLHCVCPPLAALAETVKERIWTGDFVADVVAAMRKHTSPPFDPKVFSLDQLAADWHDRLARLVEDARLQIAPRFFEAAQ